MMNELSEAYHILKQVRDACLYTDDDNGGSYIAVTEEPYISHELFDKICQFINEHKKTFE